ncbi:DUF1415 domain-containing protein [Agriterribacter humi]|jgi:hypothetical protein|uniref:DUF1415 domain-containing protein n=1 Tax=Agriterribacter humi TaxID=1104781 RepID=UPI001264B9B3|nr:DUF1415 domain-containing protein [Agriterribacter humi]
MNAPDIEIIITQTKKWITDVVVGCNFCPFAAKELKRNTVHYKVLANATAITALEAVLALLRHLDDNDNIETSFLILPGSFPLFDAYLDLVDLAEKLLAKENYEGIYQVASFHPQYIFAGSRDNDPSNYTNRSPYAMLHFLREDSVSKAVDSYPAINKVPERNIAFTREKGLRYMQQLLADSL